MTEQSRISAQFLYARNFSVPVPYEFITKESVHLSRLTNLKTKQKMISNMARFNILALTLLASRPSGQQYCAAQTREVS